MNSASANLSRGHKARLDCQTVNGSINHLKASLGLSTKYSVCPLI